MLRIVAVNWRNYLGRGVEYCNILHDSIMRNLPDGFPGEFIVLTDNEHEEGYTPGIILHQLPEGLIGWWNHLYAYKNGLFDDGDRIILIDLDMLITGPLDDIVAYDGPFATLSDFYRPGKMQCSITFWPANTMGHVWEAYEKAGRPTDFDDQVFLEAVHGECTFLQDVFPGAFCSYKVHAKLGIPKGTKVVVFHGLPRPHEVTADWVGRVWKIGGGTSAEMVVEANIPIEQIGLQIKSALLRGGRFLQVKDVHDGVAMVCAGGPSIHQDLGLIRHLQAQGVKLFAVNGSYQFLEQRGAVPDVHVLLDGRQENISFVPVETQAEQIYSSQCHPEVLDASKNLTLYHPFFDGVLDIVGPNDTSAFIGGGTTAGLKAVCIAFALGYRKIHMFGFDSAYLGGEGHAYSQPLNAKDRVLDVSFLRWDFKCAPWMVTQAEDFERLMPELMSSGCEIFVHGDGLIPAIAEEMGRYNEVEHKDAA